MNKLQILKLLENFEQKSTCPKKQVAAMLIPKRLLEHDWLDSRIDPIEWGANICILPHKHITCERCLEGYKGCLCPAIHAEAQCLIGTQFNETVGSTLVVSWSPCPECCKLIVSAGISRVVIKNPRLKKPSKVDCSFYNVTTYDELAETLLSSVQYTRLWEQDEDWKVN